MKPGDLVINLKQAHTGIKEYGLYIGDRTFVNHYVAGVPQQPYTCAEVIWFKKTAPNGDVVSTIQKDLIGVVNESR